MSSFDDFNSPNSKAINITFLSYPHCISKLYKQTEYYANVFIYSMFYINFKMGILPGAIYPYVPASDVQLDEFELRSLAMPKSET